MKYILKLLLLTVIAFGFVLFLMQFNQVVSLTIGGFGIGWNDITIFGLKVPDFHGFYIPKFIIYTQAWKIILVVLVLLMILGYILKSIAGLFDNRFFSKDKRNLSKQKKSYNALQSGLSAIAAGETAKALKYGQKVEKNAGDGSLSNLLIAQAAFAEKNMELAEQKYLDLLKDSKTRLLGYKGLYAVAMENKDDDEAKAIALRSFELHPKSSWAYNALFNIYIYEGDLDAALKHCDIGAKRHIIPIATSKLYKAMIYTEQCRLIFDKGAINNVINIINKALSLKTNFIPAHLMYIKAMIKSEQNAKAIAEINKIWPDAPRADLADLWLQATKNMNAKERYIVAKKLTAKNLHHEESLLLLAKTAIDSEAWDDANDYLMLAKDIGVYPQQKCFQLLAELEHKHPMRGDELVLRAFLIKMSGARVTPHWQEKKGGYHSDEWTLLTPSGDFDGWFWDDRQTVEPKGNIAISDLSWLRVKNPKMLVDEDVDVKKLSDKGIE